MCVRTRNGDSWSEASMGNSENILIKNRVGVSKSTEENKAKEAKIIFGSVAETA